MPGQSDQASRCALMVEVTLETLRDDPELRLCEGLRLIEATRTALGRAAPTELERFDRELLPRMRHILMQRFGVGDCSCNGSN